MSMVNPTHPGAFIREEYLKALNLSVTEGAKILGVARQTLDRVVNERAAVSPEMAVRIEKAFGGSARLLLAMQTQYDLAQVDKRKIKVQRYAGAA